MSGAEEDRKRAARAEQVALFRYQLIREAADPGLSTRQRRRLVRELAAKAHPGPFGDPVAVSRATIDSWIRAWNAGGFTALAPPARQVTLRTDAHVLELGKVPGARRPRQTQGSSATLAQQSVTKITQRHRAVNGAIGLVAPKAVIRQRCALCQSKGKPAQRDMLLHDDDSHQRRKVPGPVLPPGPGCIPPGPSPLGHGDLAAQQAGRQAPLDGQ